MDIGLIILLIVVGIILVVAELLLVPGGILTGVVGVCALVSSCFVAFSQYGSFAGIITVIITVSALTALIIYVLRGKTWEKAALNTKIDAKVDINPVEKGIEEGLLGICMTRLNPTGRVLFDTGVEAEVQSVDGLLDVKSSVIVFRVDNGKIFVKKANQ